MARFSYINKVWLGLFFCAISSFGQEVETTQKGLWKVMVQDTVYSQHTRQDKAVSKAINLQLNEGILAYVLPFDRLDFTVSGRLKVPAYVPLIDDEDISVMSVSATKANIRIDSDMTGVDYVYIEFYADGEVVEQTTKGLVSIYSFLSLKPDTTYFYKVVFAMVDGSIKMSNIKTIKTL